MAMHCVSARNVLLAGFAMRCAAVHASLECVLSCATWRDGQHLCFAILISCMYVYSSHNQKLGSSREHIIATLNSAVQKAEKLPSGTEMKYANCGTFFFYSCFSLRSFMVQTFFFGVQYFARAGKTFNFAAKTTLQQMPKPKKKGCGKIFHDSLLGFILLR